ncbi:MAG: hypothetical protein HY681_02930 [Chloroflexi bacterium]|nr:hypothetical protein [Chloroflexota bacterium]
MPIGAFVNNIPMPLFMLVHLTGFVVGAVLAYRSFGGGARLFGSGFALYALAEVSYMTYHLDWTVFLFAHTISEVFDLLGFVLVFAGLARRGIKAPVASNR